MTIEQFLKSSLETEMPEFERLKINAIDMAETIGLDRLKEQIKAANNFKQMEPCFEMIMDGMDVRYGWGKTILKKLKLAQL